MMKLIRVRALIRKETRQMLRDKSTLTLGVLLPMMLLLLFGFGLSVDVKGVHVTLARDNSSPVARDLYMNLKLSPYYFTPTIADSWHDAEAMLRSGETKAIVRVDKDDGIQIIVNGRDSNTARIMLRYLEGAVSLWSSATTQPLITAESRVWYNSALESRYFLVPGVTVLIMTLIGTLLTALVMAREWERGTYEALAATPVSRFEILIGKIVPYFALGMVGLSLCLATSAWVFDVPMRGSLALITAGSAIYLLVSLGIGLFISAVVKKQFKAGQIALIFSLLPTMMLSGFVFDLRSVPVVAYYIAHALPATWYVDMLQTLFLVGNIWLPTVRDMLVLSAFAVLLMGLAISNIRKALE
ncbi:MAG: ABC transporter permease [Synergistaceae bacterium]|jgi:ABC-2 type transport system permease protein|nr:ABC transporter permease [Synergistaceae bacterium]